MPQRKEIEYLDKDYNFSINQKKDKKNKDVILGKRLHIHIFIILLFVFLVMVLLFLNFDVLSIYLDI